MTNTSLINLETLIDDAKCFEILRQLRWSQGIDCYDCQSTEIVKRGFDETQPSRQRYQCKACHKRFDDLSDTFRRTSSASTDLDCMLVLPGIEPVQSPNCSRT